MPASQLKRLKASLREQGIVGPQKSKKQKKALATQNAGARDDKRLQRSVVLENIRGQFNPFDLKLNARGPKFEVTTNRPAPGTAAGGIRGRPGAAKSLAEERRRQTLLVEMQRKHKVGGLLDRRYGEEDPDQEMDEIMMERFAKEKQRSHKKSAFNLEDDDDEPTEGLTHGGRALDLSYPAIRDDFDEDDLGGDSDGSIDGRKQLKRMRSLGNLEDEMEQDGDEDDEETGQPERKKSKKEVMEEVIAKSKMYKAERQATKEAAEDLREDLDSQFPEIRELLLNDERVAEMAMRGGKYDVAVIAGKDKAAFDKDFDKQVRMLRDDKRARPTDRTKTEEEQAEAESEKLKTLEEQRLKRMAGERVSDDESDREDDDDEEAGQEAPAGVFFPEEIEDDGFGLGRGIRARPTATDLGFEDEDDFLIDDNLVASGSELEFESGDEEDYDEEGESGDDDDNDQEGDGQGQEDDEFTTHFLNAEARAQALASQQAEAGSEDKDADGLPVTLACPQSLEEFLAMTRPFPADKVPAIVQRIRALYHPKLDSRNKEKLGRFAIALVDYIARPRSSTDDDDDDAPPPPFCVLESIIRHVHSLAKSFCAIEIAKQFRTHIALAGRERPLALHAGDLTLLAAVGSIFPTSDHFHQVVTPAMLVVGRFLGQKVPATLQDYATGAFLCALVLEYQRLAKRFVPELVNFCLNAVLALAPVPTTKKIGDFPVHEGPAGTRIVNATGTPVRKLSFSDLSPSPSSSSDSQQPLKVAILATLIQVLDTAAETWAPKPAILESLLLPASLLLTHLSSPPSLAHLPSSLATIISRTTTHIAILSRSALLSRRPLLLHAHRPLAIKTHTPKFEGHDFDPSKHYDPDRERADLARLRKEHKRERKGAMRELRRDNAFVMRENLRVKKARDDAYERKHARILAEIQTEAGQEANEYEREKKARQRTNKRARG